LLLFLLSLLLSLFYFGSQHVSKLFSLWTLLVLFFILIDFLVLNYCAKSCVEFQLFSLITASTLGEFSDTSLNWITSWVSSYGIRVDSISERNSFSYYIWWTVIWIYRSSISIRLPIRWCITQINVNFFGDCINFRLPNSSSWRYLRLIFLSIVILVQGLSLSLSRWLPWRLFLIFQFLSWAKSLNNPFYTFTTFDHVYDKLSLKEIIVLRNVILKLLEASTNLNHNIFSLHLTSNSVTPNKIKLSFDVNNRNDNIEAFDLISDSKI